VSTGGQARGVFSNPSLFGVCNALEACLLRIVKDMRMCLQVPLSNSDTAQAIFTALQNLTSLQCLSIGTDSRRKYSVHKLPESLGALTGLTQLKFSTCTDRCEQLPDSIGKLKNLQRLDFAVSSFDSIQQLPDSFTQLTALTAMELSSRALQKLPENIGHLQKLEQLTLFGCSHEQLLASVMQLTGLEHLCLVDCTVQELPDNLSKLQKLKSMYIWNGNIMRLPDCVSRLTELETLEVGGALKELPDVFHSLTSLTRVDVSPAALSQLPESFVSLTGLRELGLSRCDQLKALPVSMTQLTALSAVTFYGCRLLEDTAEMLTAFLGVVTTASEQELLAAYLQCNMQLAQQLITATDIFLLSPADKSSTSSSSTVPNGLLQYWAQLQEALAADKDNVDLLLEVLSSVLKPTPGDLVGAVQHTLSTLRTLTSTGQEGKLETLHPGAVPEAYSSTSWRIDTTQDLLQGIRMIYAQLPCTASLLQAEPALVAPPARTRGVCDVPPTQIMDAHQSTVLHTYQDTYIREQWHRQAADAGLSVLAFHLHTMADKRWVELLQEAAGTIKAVAAAVQPDEGATSSGSSTPTASASSAGVAIGLRQRLPPQQQQQHSSPEGGASGPSTNSSGTGRDDDDDDGDGRGDGSDDSSISGGGGSGGGGSGGGSSSDGQDVEQQHCILYATDRAPWQQSGQTFSFGGVPANPSRLRFGSITTGQPVDSHQSMLQALSTAYHKDWSLETFDQPAFFERIAVLLQPQHWQEGQEQKQKQQQQQQRQVLMVIHGYHTSFDGAVRAAAQLAYGIRHQGPVVVYSWASAGNWWSYFTDVQRADQTVQHLVPLLQEFDQQVRALLITTAQFHTG